MDKKHKIGRNDPCPCGSGKKYKRCCGATPQSRIAGKKERDYLKLNKEIAYKGKIGRQRQEFCVSYIKHKRLILKKATQEQIKHAEGRGETITCHKGCSFCCQEYIGASLQECEAIVYYLYQNEEVLTAFVQAYQRWRAEVEKNKDLLERIGQLYDKMWASRFSEESKQAFINEGAHYANQNMPCPFLSDGACSIYEVRPWACASQFATSPPEWCNPLNPNKHKRKIYLDDFGGTVELPFWDKRIQAHVRFTMPLGVYEILQNGFLYLSLIPGLEGLPDEVRSEPEVRVILQRYRKSH